MALNLKLTPLAARAFILSAVVIVFDQLSKWIVLGPLNFSPPGCFERLGGCGRLELSSIFDLTMVWNRGVSFGLFEAESLLGRVALSAFALVVAGMLSRWILTADRPLSALALGGVVGGAIGNLIDRVRFGAVVDFFDFSGLYFPFVFNVADAAISIGVGVLLLDLVLQERQARRRVV